MAAQAQEKPKQAKWTPEDTTLLPDFALVKSNTNMEFIIHRVDLPDFHDPAFDPFTFDPDTLTAFVKDKWMVIYQKKAVPVVLAKNQEENWTAYLARLRSWTSARNMLSLPDEWYLDQMRANILSSQDKFECPSRKRQAKSEKKRLFICCREWGLVNQLWFQYLFVEGNQRYVGLWIDGKRRWSNCLERLGQECSYQKANRSR